MTIEDRRGLQRTVSECEGLSVANLDYSGLFWAIEDCEGLLRTDVDCMWRTGQQFYGPGGTFRSKED